MRTIRSLAVLVITTTAITSAQRATTFTDDDLDRNVATQVAALSSQLKVNAADASEWRRREAEIKAVTDRLRINVDRHIESAMRPEEGSQRIEARLRTVLAGHSPNPEYGDGPLARVADVRAGRSLVVAYTVVRGPHHDTASIRGYRSDFGRFQFVAATGDDFDGYNMFKSSLVSPLADEFWLLAWGQAQTFNGKKVRFRIYSFDGQTFKTVWQPDDLLNATVQITQTGFTIERETKEPPFAIRDQYALTANGPIKVN